jgi:hypothetical protein
MWGDLMLRLWQWVCAVMNGWLAWAGAASVVAWLIPLIWPDSFKDFPQYHHGAGIVAIGLFFLASFVAWKKERDDLEDVNYRPNLLVDGPFEYTDRSGGFDAAFSIVAKKADIENVKVQIFGHFSHRRSVQPVKRAFDYLQVDRPQAIVIQEWRGEGINVGSSAEDPDPLLFGCEVHFRFKSVRTGDEYTKQENLDYDPMTRKVEVTKIGRPQFVPQNGVTSRIFAKGALLLAAMSGS